MKRLLLILTSHSAVPHSGYLEKGDFQNKTVAAVVYEHLEVASNRAHPFFSIFHPNSE